MKKAKGKTGKEAIERAGKELSTITSVLQENVEKLASRACRLYDLRRELMADHRQGLLTSDGVPAGLFRDRQIVILEETERLREDLCRLGGPCPDREDALRLLMAILPKRCHPDAPNPFQVAAQVMFAWTRLSHLCELDALPPISFSADAPDFVAAGTAQAVPSEERIDQIIATGTRCVALLKEFCAYRKIEIAGQ